MSIPSNGTVVIVDDTIEGEAFPLIEALSRRGIAVRFYVGKGSSLPDKPIKGVRLLFLDLKLEGINFDADSEDIAKSLKPVVDRIIGPDNGPYILFGWTKTPRHLQALFNILENKPVLMLDMEKNACMSDGVCDFSKIEAKLFDKIKQIGHLATLFDWENIVNDAAKETINKLMQEVGKMEDVESLLYYLGRAAVGDNVDSLTGEQRIKAALQCLNVLLSDSVSMILKNNDFSSAGDVKPVGSLAHGLVSAINAKLLLGQTLNNEPYPGNVYIEFTSERKEKILSFIKERIVITKIAKSLVIPKIPADIQGMVRDTVIREQCVKIEKEIIAEKNMVFVEITPVCDYAQSNHKYHRVISGFLIACDYYEELEHRMPEKSGFYVSPHILFEKYSGCFRLILDCRGLVTLELDSLKAVKPLFRINDELLFDIQHKAGSHFSRPGITALY